MQTLEFTDVSYPGASGSVGVGLNQPRNGPCGVIAAIQAVASPSLCRSGTAPAKMQVTDDILASVLTAMLWQARLDDTVKLVTKAASEANGGVDIATFTDKEALHKAVSEAIGYIQKCRWRRSIWCIPWF